MRTAPASGGASGVDEEGGTVTVGAGAGAGAGGGVTVGSSPAIALPSRAATSTVLLSGLIASAPEPWSARPAVQPLAAVSATHPCGPGFEVRCPSAARSNTATPPPTDRPT